MKALVLTGKHEVHLGSFPEPPLAANAVKIAVAYSAAPICISMRARAALVRCAFLYRSDTKSQEWSKPLGSK